MTEVVPADRARLLQSKREECSAIARSRKRKLCILYEVSASPDDLPKRSFADPDAKLTNLVELQFLEGCDILQGRRLNELNVPARPRTRSEYPRRLSQNVAFASNENVAPIPSKPTATSISHTTGLPPPSTTRPSHSEGRSNAVASPAPSIPSQPSHSVLAREHEQTPSATPTPAVLGVDQPSKPEASKAQEEAASNWRDAAPRSIEALPTISTTLPQRNSSTNLTVSSQRTSFHRMPERERNQGENTLMDIDLSSAAATTPVTAPTPQLPQAEVRPNDILSSPGSTAQSATTPAVHDISANTSPGHDAESFNDRIEERAERKPSESGPTSAQKQPTHTEGSVPTISSKDPPQRLELPSTTGPRSLTTGEVTPVSIELDPKEHLKVPIPATTPSPSRRTHALESDRSATSNQTRRDTVEISPQSERTPNGQLQHEHEERSRIDLNTNEQTHSGDITSGPSGLKPPISLVKEPRENTTAIPPSPSPASVFREAASQVPESVTEVALQKPVSEILGERPDPAPVNIPSTSDFAVQQTTPITPTSQISKSRLGGLAPKAKCRDKSKLSTVVFGKPSRPSESEKSLVQNRSKENQLFSDDYFTPLFIQSFATGSKWMKPLDQILHQAHKTLSTPDSYTQILDNQACRVLRKVYTLQHDGKWSLRQPKRCPEPIRQACHWDVLLKEMKWMRTDFREERKWKMAAARNLAHACAEWVEASQDDRRAMQVNAVAPHGESSDDGDVSMIDPHYHHESEIQPTPDLIPSGDSQPLGEMDEDPEHPMLDAVPPSAIFALPDDDIVFAIQPSPNTDRLLEELPMYGSPLKAPSSDLIAPEFDPDASWKRPALPLSKYVEGEIQLTSSEPPQIRSRFSHAQEDEEEDEVIFGQQGHSQTHLEPENPDVALFRPENKAIRDRLHASHQFRPPSEHVMPFQTFYESRSPSQWTQPEDDELKSLVREHSYNWSLISSMLSSKSLFAAGAERRTPWECFERWVMLEGLPHDMQKTQYFKLWQNRIEQAQQHIRQQNQNALQQQQQQQQQQQSPQQSSSQQSQPQPGSAGPVTPLPRRRLSLPIRVERRRNQKHLTMIDAMRKLAKKRETTLHKQQQAASLAAMRKANEPPQPRAPNKTPRDYSLMKHERDQAMAERLAERVAQQQQRHEANRRVGANPDPSLGRANQVTQAAMQRSQQGQVTQTPAAQNASQPSQNNAQMAASHPHAAMARAAAPNQMAVNGQARPRMPVNAIQNGNGSQSNMAGGLVPPMHGINGGRVQMPVVNGQSRIAMSNPSPEYQLLLQAQQISEQQRRSVQMRQQQVHPNQPMNAPTQTSPPAMRPAAMNGLNQKNYLNNLNNAQAQALLASYNTANGPAMSSSSAGGSNISSGQAGSPRPTTMIPQQPHHQTYVAQLQQIESQLRQSSPNTPQNVIRDMATQMIQSRHNNLTQSAMNAAAGGQGQTATANGPHQYAQLLRAQQQQQAAAAAAHAQAQAQAQAQSQQNSHHQRNSSGSATPTASVPK